MKKRMLFLFFSLIFSFVYGALLPGLAPAVYAQGAPSCNIVINQNPSSNREVSVSVSATDVIFEGSRVNSSGLGDGYFKLVLDPKDVSLDDTSDIPIPDGNISNGTLSAIDISLALKENLFYKRKPAGSTFPFWVYLARDNPFFQSDITICTGQFEITKLQPFSCGRPRVSLSKRSNNEVNVAVSVDGSGLDNNKNYYFYFAGHNTAATGKSIVQLPLMKDHGDLTVGSTQTLNDGEYTFVISHEPYRLTYLDIRNYKSSDHDENCISSFTVDLNILPIDDDPWDTFKKPFKDNELAQFELCDQVKAEDKDKCLACITNTGGSASGTNQKITGLWTAIGCIPTSKEGIVTSLVRVGLGVSGGVIVLLVLAAAFMLATSAGDAKKVAEAQEMITSAVIGLLFVIFSVMIFRFIFTSILKLPGF